MLKYFVGYNYGVKGVTAEREGGLVLNTMTLEELRYPIALDDTGLIFMHLGNTR